MSRGRRSRDRGYISGNRTIAAPTYAEVLVNYLVVAGGGGGGNAVGYSEASGGGGAGGYRSSVVGENSGGGASAETTVVLFTGLSYTVTVGGGGAGTSSYGPATSGVNSSISMGSGFTTTLNIESRGGGWGNGDGGGTVGGSGGAGGAGSINRTGGAGTTGQGFAGGNGFGSATISQRSGGGGGGAGAVGSNASSAQGGAGGAGVSSSITGSPVTRAGGGGGSSQTTAGAGGSGGGGAGNGTNNGTANTGSGGGAVLTGTSGAGGSGVVILRYPNLFALNVGAGLAYSTQAVSDDKVTTFTGGSGSVSFSLVPVTTGDYESIATVLVGSAGASSITFSNIPQTYKHLQIRMLIGSNTSTSDSTDMRFNGDAGSNYTYHQLYGTGSSVSSEASTPRTAAVVGIPAISNTNTNIFATGVVDILDYANTNKYKTQRTLGGWETNSNGQALLTSTSWLSFSAISQIQIYARDGHGFRQHSHFALYGIRG